MKYYVINLDRSIDRWQDIKAELKLFSIEPTRVPAVDGKTIDQQDWMPDFDAAKFRFNHGVEPLPGEYGCYASHLAALSAFLADGGESCVIFEDDVQPLDPMATVVDYLNVHKTQSPLLVRLITNRIEFYEKLETLPENHSLGQCWFGPSGCSAAYWVTRTAAQILIDTLRPGFLPIDASFERAWETGVANYVLKPNVCALRAVQSTIGETAPLHYRKPIWYKRLGALQCRTRGFFARIIWCLMHRSSV
jgi:glycosyl transferase, family 25